MKTYRRHHCDRAHRSHRTLAQCIWKRAHWVIGDGQFASVSYCRGVTVMLHATAERAEAAKRTIDATYCGGRCVGRHDVIYLSLPSSVMSPGRRTAVTDVRRHSAGRTESAA